MNTERPTERQSLFARIDAARVEYARALDLSPACDVARREDAMHAAGATLRQALAELEPMRPR